MIIFFQAYFSGRRLEHLKFPAFLGEVNPESIYDAQMFNKKSDDFNRIVKNPFLFNLLISLDIS